ncbi:MAG: noncanonical pyrimidine nucleotidase, YjjG family [Saprospiraceae bacterium]|nr:noncanonical pyrimidine nucleotidase, YjjG family [Saprospiraceae bacterium]
MYKYLLFDADDTLFDFSSASHAAFHQFYKEFLDKTGKSEPELYHYYKDANMMVWEEFEQGYISIETLKFKRFDLFYKLARITTRANPQEASAFYLKQLILQSTLLPQATDLLNQLSVKCSLSLITNGIAEVQHARIQKLGIRSSFKHIFISEEIGYSKPDKGFFDHVMNTLRLSEPAEILIIGDSLKADMAGAHNAGIDACWYNPKGLVNETSLPVTYEIRELSQILDIVN